MTRSPEKRGLSVFAMRVTEVFGNIEKEKRPKIVAIYNICMYIKCSHIFKVTEWMDVYEESVFPFSIANVLTILPAMILHALVIVLTIYIAVQLHVT